MKSVRYFFYVAFIVIVAIKFFYLYLSSRNDAYSLQNVYHNGDATHYYIIAENLEKYATYSDNNSTVASQSATWRPPFWPFVLSVFMFLTPSPIVLLLLKSVLEIAIIVLAIYLFQKKNKVSTFTLLFFLLLLLEPQYLKYSVTFLSESLSAVLLLLVSVLFISTDVSKNISYLIPVLLAVLLLCHPVAAFFIVLLFGSYLLLNFRNSLKTCMFQFLLFVSLVSLWPVRNYLTFNQGFYLTASQGATFSKGWNEKVSTNFTNVDGDLADESMNLKYIAASEVSKNPNVLETSALYKKATQRYIEKLTFKEKLAILSAKISSNFNPFPEKPKETFIDRTAIFFRCLYLLVFIQVCYRFLRFKRIQNTTQFKVSLVVAAIFFGQLFMSMYIYTGLRFNAVYGLTLFFVFVYFNVTFIKVALFVNVFKNRFLND